jgi:FAD/FMN-containing dehydrogenase
MAVDTLTHGINSTLRSRGFTGELVTPGDSAYAQARRVWNGSIERWPAAVARCRDAEDVAAVIGGAIRLGLPLSVRGGGHSVAGHSTCDDGIVLDLAPMRQVAIDPRTRRARVAGGALLGDLDHAAQEHGLAVPAGQVSHTGVAGLTLGGGVGYLMRPLGLTIDSLHSARLVTAAGEPVTASEDENPDLFWALRGGGGNFGVVTDFQFDLHEVGPIIYAGVLVFPLERGGEILRASGALMAGAPDELTIHEVLITLPHHPPFPPELQGTKAAMLVVAHLGTEEQAQADVAPLRELDPSFDLLGPMPYLALQTMIDEDTRHGLGHYSKSHWLAGFDDELIDVLVERLGRATSPMSHLITARMGGEIERVPAEATAFRYRSAANLLWAIGLWEDASDPGDEHRAWVNEVMEAAAPFSIGAGYVNAIEGDEDAARVRDAYGEDTFARLRQVKRRWDPDNVFRLNANIPPATD